MTRNRARSNIADIGGQTNFEREQERNNARMDDAKTKKHTAIDIETFAK